MLGIHLDEHKKMSCDVFKTYNKPEYVYIPFVVGKNKDVIEYIKKGDYVYKEMVIGKTKGNFQIPILSSVSGEVIDFENHCYLDGTSIKCAKIKNDFKEKIEKKAKIKKNIQKYTKQEFVDLLKETAIIGLSGNGFPTYLKYETNEINTLIVNAVECEPYITADYVLIQNHIKELLECIDAIMEINKIEECFIAIKKNNKKTKELINQYIGTYLKIKLIEVPNKYPMGWEKALVKYIKNEKYEKLPIEKHIVVNNISTIYAIYEALKYHKPLLERIITITGDGIKNPCNVLVKNGTNIKDILENYKIEKDVNFIAGGPMMGTMVDEDLIVTPNLNNLLVMKKTNYLLEQQCLRCGKCIKNCPVKIEPVLIKDNLSNIEKLKQFRPEKCIECGLCSYICPANINLREYVKQAKESIRGKQK